MQNNRRWHPDKYRHAVDCSYTPSLSTNIYTGLIIKARIKQNKPKLKGGGQKKKKVVILLQPM